MTEDQLIDGILWCFMVAGGLFSLLIIVSGLMLIGEKLYKWWGRYDLL